MNERKKNKQRGSERVNYSVEASDIRAERIIMSRRQGKTASSYIAVSIALSLVSVTFLSIYEQRENLDNLKILHTCYSPLHNF